MRLRSPILATVVVAAVLAGPALAQTRTSHAHAGAELASMQLEQDPFASVYIVTSRDTYRYIRTIARNGVARRDSVGTALMVSEIKAHQLSEVSGHIHQRELRCGGYFAFKSRKEADAFIRADRSAAIAGRSLVAYTIDNQSTVNPWLPQVQESNLYNTINQLSSYQNRYYTSATGKSSAEWIRTTWQGLAAGRSDVSTELFTACSDCSTQPSVILTIQGTELPNEILVLGAHLDSINGNTGSTGRAPGADDDASGIATLTEVIRVALSSGWQPKRTVKFMGYAAEEVGLRGSKAISQSFKNSGKNVVGVMQLDMTNYKSGSVEDMQLVTDYSNADMKAFLVNLFDTYLAPLGLSRGTYTCGYGCSDHASWTSAGYPAAMMFEAGDSGGYFPYIHTADDTLANMGESAQHSVKFAKLGLAFLGELGKSSGGGSSAPTANFSATSNGLTATFTDASTDSNGSIISRNWNFGDGSTSTVTNPGHAYAAGGSYTVSLTVTDNEGLTGGISKVVTVSAPGGSVLSNGVPVTGLSGAAAAELRYTMAVPAGATGLKFVTSGGSGDADLYVKFGSAPTTTSYTCKSEGSSNAETCAIATAQAGTYHVLVKAYATFSGLSLTGSYSTGGGGSQTYTNAADYPIRDNTTVESPITISGRSGNAPSNTAVAVNIVHTYKGDLKVDLVAPDGSVYVLHNRSGGSADNIVTTYTVNLSTETLSGIWKLRVNDNGAGDIGYLNSWSVTF